MDKIRHIVSLFELKSEMAEMVLLGLFFLMVIAVIRNKIIRVAVSQSVALILVLQLISLYFTRTFIGYSFYIHFNLQGIEGMASLFTVQIFYAILLYLSLSILFYYSRAIIDKIIGWVNRTFLRKKPRDFILLRWVLLGFILVSLTYNQRMIGEASQLFSQLQTDKKAFNKALIELNLEDYTPAHKIECKKGKNIIVISVESLERGFLSDKFSKLTPNLLDLRSKWNYYNLEQNTGSNWTSGSLYTYMTGFPALFGVQGNSIFKNAHHSEIPSIIQTLKKAKYETTYLIGNADHSGIREMLFSLGIGNVIDKKSIYKTGANNDEYGIKDKDLFEIAKKEIKSKASLNIPFALFISTTDTHFPDGIYDKRMEKYVSPQESNLEFMVSAVDYMIGDFIDFLEEENILSNTVVYIFPDHLKMGSPDIFEGTGTRGLYILTNAEENDLSINPNETLYQIDLPKIILKGAKIKHNQKFLTDYISGNKNKFIDENIYKITSLNSSGLLRTGFKPFILPPISSNYVKYTKDTLRFIAHAGGMIDNNTYTNSLEALNANYKKGFRVFELDIIKTKDDKYVAAHDWVNWSKIADYKGEIPATEKEFLKYKILKKYTPLSMDSINAWFSKHPDAILVTDKINEPKKFSKSFIDKNRLMMELFDMEAVKEGLDAKIKSAMPSQNVIEKMENDIVEKLKAMGVKDIVISRTFIDQNVTFLKNLKKNGINAYAFHINYISGFDEEYVVKYEMDYIYGIYADKWSFEK